MAKQDSSTTGQGSERLETKLRAKNRAGNQVKRTNGEASVELEWDWQNAHQSDNSNTKQTPNYTQTFSSEIVKVGKMADVLESVDLKEDGLKLDAGDKLVWVYGLHTVPVVEAARRGVLS